MQKNTKILEHTQTHAHTHTRTHIYIHTPLTPALKHTPNPPVYTKPHSRPHPLAIYIRVCTRSHTHARPFMYIRTSIIDIKLLLNH